MTPKGIMIVGLNGVGKTTMGRALAERLGWFHIDVENYYFPDMTIPYANPMSDDEVRRQMLLDIRHHGNFVLSSVRASWGPECESLCVLAVWLRAPLAVRMARIDQREKARFGDRVLPGGDMYEGQQRFHAMAAGRHETMVEESLRTLQCPTLMLDATRSLMENVNHVLSEALRTDPSLCSG